MYDLYKTIEMLCQSKGISINKMCKLSGAAQGSVADLKGGRSKTLSAQNISKIAAFFDVSTDYLLGVVDEYGLTESDWKLMGQVYKERREKSGIDAKDACDGDVIDHSHLVGFELMGLKLTLQQLDVICGMIGTTAPDVFSIWADKLWGEKNKPTVIDDELADELELLRSRPEVRTLLHASKNMTPAQVERMAQFMLEMKGDGNEKTD